MRKQAGYSGTPLVKKLGLKEKQAAFVIHPPENYTQLLGDSVASPITSTEVPHRAGFIHLFSTVRAELENTADAVFKHMARDGMFWVSWPKKASKVPTEITEDTIREICLPIGLVDVKVCAIDDVWSGLKLVIRKELR